MAKEYTWKVDLDDREHTVICQEHNSGYDLFVDDEHIKRVYPKSFQSLRKSTVEQFGICGHSCKIVFWDVTPELVVDGILAGNGQNYAQVCSKRRKQYCLTGGILLFVSLVLGGLCIANILKREMFFIALTAFVYAVFCLRISLDKG